VVEKAERRVFMIHAKVIKFTRDRDTAKQPEPEKLRPRAPINAGKNGRVYSRGGKLWVDFHYLGQRVREPSGLKDSPANQRQLRSQLDLVIGLGSGLDQRRK